MDATADFNLFSFIHAAAGVAPLLDALIVFLASWLIWAMAAVSLLSCLHAARAGASWDKHGWRTFVHAGIAVGVGLLCNRVIGLFYFRPRPFISHLGVHPLVSVTPYMQSFPSGHATAAFAIATAVAAAHPRLGRWMFVCATLVALGRVLAGVHYPADILAGAVVGSASAIAVGFAINASTRARRRAAAAQNPSRR